MTLIPASQVHKASRHDHNSNSSHCSLMHCLHCNIIQQAPSETLFRQRCIVDLSRSEPGVIVDHQGLDPSDSIALATSTRPWPRRVSSHILVLSYHIKPPTQAIHSLTIHLLSSLAILV